MRSFTPAQVAQSIDEVRASTGDERSLAQALEIGTALLRESRFAEALELFDALAQKKPRDSVVLYGRALATFNVGRVADAEPLARSAVDAALATPSAPGVTDRDRSQRAADALVLLAVVLAVRGDDAGALRAVEQAVSLAHDNFDAQLALGRVLFGMGDDSGATRAFRAANGLRPSNGQALFYLATSLERAGDAIGALTTYRELITLQPGMAEGHLGLGVLLLKRSGSEVEEGIKELRRALEINPNIYEARVTLGRALIAQGRADEALEHLRRAAELAPNNPEPHYQMSLAYRRLGNKDQAAAESEIVKRIHESRRSGKPANNSDQP
jgi:Flp pilus assembly protein TadD